MMKRILLGAVCALSLGVVANAQETFRKGTQTLGFAVGTSGASNISIPAISITYERSIADGIFDYGSIGLGAQVEGEFYSANIPVLNDISAGSTKMTGRSIFAGARGTFHYEVVDRLDTYAGIQAGILYSGGSINSYSNNSTRFRFDGIIGARYTFNEKVGVFGEFGTGISTFKVGFALTL